MSSLSARTWFDREIVPRFGALAIALTLALTMAACSFAPVYGNGDAARYAVRYAEPRSRLEQIVYQDLKVHLGHTESTGAPLVRVRVSSSSIEPGRNAVGLAADITVTEPDDTVIFSGNRAASASYTSSPQLLADQQAANEAAERTARQLAETVRLTLIGVLADRPAATASIVSAPSVPQ